MVRRKMPRRPSGSKVVRFDPSQQSTDATIPDAALFQLVREMRRAEQTFLEALDSLAEAEQRFAALPEHERRLHPNPPWLVAAQQREGAAGEGLEAIYRRIADTPTTSKVGLALKLQIVLLLYGEDVDDVTNSDDMVLILLHSLLNDLSER